MTVVAVAVTSVVAVVAVVATGKRSTGAKKSDDDELLVGTGGSDIDVDATVAALGLTFLGAVGTVVTMVIVDSVGASLGFSGVEIPLESATS